MPGTLLEIYKGSQVVKGIVQMTSAHHNYESFWVYQKEDLFVGEH